MLWLCNDISGGEVDPGSLYKLDNRYKSYLKEGKNYYIDSDGSLSIRPPAVTPTLESDNEDSSPLDNIIDIVELGDRTLILREPKLEEVATWGPQITENAFLSKLRKVEKPWPKPVEKLNIGITNTNSVFLNWEYEQATDETLSFIVYRRESGGRWSYLAITQETFFEDTNASYSATYDYRVQSSNWAGYSSIVSTVDNYPNGITIGKLVNSHTTGVAASYVGDSRLKLTFLLKVDITDTNFFGRERKIIVRLKQSKYSIFLNKSTSARDLLHTVPGGTIKIQPSAEFIDHSKFGIGTYYFSAEIVFELTSTMLNQMKDQSGNYEDVSFSVSSDESYLSEGSLSTITLSDFDGPPSNTLKMVPRFEKGRIFLQPPQSTDGYNYNSQGYSSKFFKKGYYRAPTGYYYFVKVLSSNFHETENSLTRPQFWDLTDAQVDKIPVVPENLTTNPNINFIPGTSYRLNERTPEFVKLADADTFISYRGDPFRGRMSQLLTSDYTALPLKHDTVGYLGQGGPFGFHLNIYPSEFKAAIEPHPYLVKGRYSYEAFVSLKDYYYRMSFRTLCTWKGYKFNVRDDLLENKLSHTIRETNFDWKTSGWSESKYPTDPNALPIRWQEVSSESTATRRNTAVWFGDGGWGITPTSQATTPDYTSPFLRDSTFGRNFLYHALGPGNERNGIFYPLEWASEKNTRVQFGYLPIYDGHNPVNDDGIIPSTEISKIVWSNEYDLLYRKDFDIVGRAYSISKSDNSVTFTPTKTNKVGTPRYDYTVSTIAWIQGGESRFLGVSAVAQNESTGFRSITVKYNPNITQKIGTDSTRPTAGDLYTETETNKKYLPHYVYGTQGVATFTTDVTPVCKDGFFTRFRTNDNEKESLSGTVYFEKVKSNLTCLVQITKLSDSATSPDNVSGETTKSAITISRQTNGIAEKNQSGYHINRFQFDIGERDKPIMIWFKPGDGAWKSFVVNPDEVERTEDSGFSYGEPTALQTSAGYIHIRFNYLYTNAQKFGLELKRYRVKEDNTEILESTKISRTGRLVDGDTLEIGGNYFWRITPYLQPGDTSSRVDLTSVDTNNVIIKAQENVSDELLAQEYDASGTATFNTSLTRTNSLALSKKLKDKSSVRLFEDGYQYNVTIDNKIYAVDAYQGTGEKREYLPNESYALAIHKHKTGPVLDKDNNLYSFEDTELNSLFSEKGGSPVLPASIARGVFESIDFFDYNFDVGIQDPEVIGIYNNYRSENDNYSIKSTSTLPVNANETYLKYFSVQPELGIMGSLDFDNAKLEKMKILEGKIWFSFAGLNFYWDKKLKNANSSVLLPSIEDLRGKGDIWDARTFHGKTELPPVDELPVIAIKLKGVYTKEGAYPTLGDNFVLADATGPVIGKDAITTKVYKLKPITRGQNTKVTIASDFDENFVEIYWGLSLFLNNNPEYTAAVDLLEPVVTAVNQDSTDLSLVPDFKILKEGTDINGIGRLLHADKSGNIFNAPNQAKAYVDEPFIESDKAYPGYLQTQFANDPLNDHKATVFNRDGNGLSFGAPGVLLYKQINNEKFGSDDPLREYDPKINQFGHLYRDETKPKTIEAVFLTYDYSSPLVQAFFDNIHMLFFAHAEGDRYRFFNLAKASGRKLLPKKSYIDDVINSLAWKVDSSTSSAVSDKYYYATPSLPIGGDASLFGTRYKTGTEQNIKEVFDANFYSQEKFKEHAGSTLLTGEVIASTDNYKVPAVDTAKNSLSLPFTLKPTIYRINADFPVDIGARFAIVGDYKMFLGNPRFLIDDPVYFSSPLTNYWNLIQNQTTDNDTLLKSGTNLQAVNRDIFETIDLEFVGETGKREKINGTLVLENGKVYVSTDNGIYELYNLNSAAQQPLHKKVSDLGVTSNMVRASIHNIGAKEDQLVSMRFSQEAQNYESLTINDKKRIFNGKGRRIAEIISIYQKHRLLLLRIVEADGSPTSDIYTVALTEQGHFRGITQFDFSLIEGTGGVDKIREIDKGFAIIFKNRFYAELDFSETEDCVDSILIENNQKRFNYNAIAEFAPIINFSEPEASNRSLKSINAITLGMSGIPVFDVILVDNLGKIDGVQNETRVEISERVQPQKFDGFYTVTPLPPNSSALPSLRIEKNDGTHLKLSSIMLEHTGGYNRG